MESRHLFELMNRLEHVYYDGFVTIRETELLNWYGRERMRDVIWADIEQKWEMVQEGLKLKPDERCELFIASGVADYVLIWGKGLKFKEGFPEAQGFFLPISMWANTKAKYQDAEEK